jgi:Undecaprenyl-phosphate glucose phosphotransferase
MLYRHKLPLSILIFVLDVFLISYLAYHSVAFKIFNQFSSTILSTSQYKILLTLCWIIPAFLLSLYALENGVNTQKFNINTLKVWFIFTIIFIVVHVRLVDIDNYKPFSHVLVLQFFYQLLYLGSTRLALTLLRHHYKNIVTTAKKIAILGFNETGIQLANTLEDNESPYDFIGILDEETQENPSNIQEFETYIAFYINQSRQLGINELYVITQPAFLKNCEHYYTLADEHFIRLKFVPDFSVYATEKFVMDEFNNFQILKSRSEPLLLYRKKMQKRVFDIVFSLVVMVCILSWLYPLIALLIKLESRGPVIFKQGRSGLQNSKFYCYKFRTMRKDNQNEAQQASVNDSRVTRIGAFLRKTSLDELPQFFNVLLGNMSVIGPRPHMIEHTEKFKKSIKNYMVRHYAKPGITGLAQISGYRGEIIKQKDINNRVKYDVEYIQNWSLGLDLKICALTFYQLIFIHKKAY